jgi:hypothetical protein
MEKGSKGISDTTFTSFSLQAGFAFLERKES